MEQMDKAEQNLAELERIAKELHKRIRIGQISIALKWDKPELEYSHYNKNQNSIYISREYVLAKFSKWEQERAIKWLT